MSAKIAGGEPPLSLTGSSLTFSPFNWRARPESHSRLIQGESTSCALRQRTRKTLPFSPSFIFCVIESPIPISQRSSQTLCPRAFSSVASLSASLESALLWLIKTVALFAIRGAIVSEHRECSKERLYIQPFRTRITPPPSSPARPPRKGKGKGVKTGGRNLGRGQKGIRCANCAKTRGP